MKAPKTILILLLSCFAPRLVQANLVGPYTVDTNTLFLLHLNEAAGGSVTTNVGSAGGNFITVNFSATGNPLPAVTSTLGFPGFSINSPTAISFGNCESNQTTGYIMGYDYNGDGGFEGDTGAANPANSDYLPLSKLGIGNGGQTPFTLEALICPSSTTGNQDIISTDSHNATRGFFFRIASGTLAFQYVGGGALTSQPLQGNIPTLAQDPENGFVANTWYHVAFTYDGTNGTVYWTKLDPSLGAAHVLATGLLTIGAGYGTNVGPLGIANRARSTGSETFLGAVDEVRISSVCRAANQMQFFSPLVTITQNPVSQNVDYNQPVSFIVGATTTGSTLGYQWRFNSNNIAGATSATYTISNVAANNGGYYDCVVTNSAGNSATSSEAQLVVGAANFLNHRYSFKSSFTNGVTGVITTPDSIASADGTNVGDAYEANGELVLDGTSGTYLQLPSGIVNGANQTAVTVEFWATFGSNPNNVYAFNFGLINPGVNLAHAFLGYSPHNASGQEMFISPADFGFAETIAAPGTLDSQAVHVACVFDAPQGVMSIYTNGVLESSGPDTVGLANINDVDSYIGASLNTGDPFLAANFSELRIYNGALSPITIAQSQDQGPGIILASGPASFVLQPVNTSVPVGWSTTFSAAATGYLPITYQWYKNGAPVPGATNASFSFVPTLGDNNANIFCYATNTIGVTTYATNSTTATLSVFTPSTLSWLGTAGGGANGTWDTTSLDWTNDLAGGGILAFAQTNGAAFDDRSGGGMVDVEQAIMPYGITVDATSSYTFTSQSLQGSLTGPGFLNKLNTGTLIIDLTNNLSGPTTISGGTLQIGNNDSSGTLSSGPLTNNSHLSLSRSDTAMAVSAPIHGSGLVSVDGSGAITISGNSDYTGGTLLNSGIVYLISGTGLGNGSATVASGAQLYLTANININEPLILNGVGDGNGSLRKGGASASVESAPVNLASDASIGVDSGATLTISNAITGGANLTVVGGGTLALNSNNTLASVTLSGTDVVDVNAPNALGSGLVTVNGAGSFVIGTGLTVANPFQASVVSPGAGNGVLQVADNTNGTVTTLSGALEFDASPATGGDFVGPVTSGYLNVTGPIVNTASGIISSRAGSVRFSGGGNYTTFDLSGNVSLGANNGLSTNASVAVGVSANGVFDLNGFSQTLAGLADGVNSELVTNSSSSPSTLSLALSGNSTYSGVIAGNISIVESGSSLLHLMGTNSYTGNTTVSGGTLEVAQPSFAAGSTVAIASGSTLQMDFTVTNTIKNLVLNGVSQSAGVYNSTTSPSFLTGSGSLLVAVPVNPTPTNISVSVTGGTLTLSWPADHTGWRLLVQTNNLANGISTNINDWGTVSGSATTNEVNIPINSSEPAEFYRMVYP